MNRLIKLLPISVMALLLLASSAFALPIFGPGYNFISFNDYENRIPNTPGSNQISAGDIFYGVATFTNVDWASTSNTSQDWVPTLNSQYVQAYFYTEVESVTPTSGGNGHIVFKTPTAADPNGVFTAADLASGVVLKWFESSTPIDFSSTLANNIASSVDGDLLMSLSIQKGYWYSDALVTVPTAPNTFLGTSFYGLNLVGGSMTDLSLINDPLESLENLDVNFYGQAKIFTSDPSNNTGKLWQFYSSDPAVIATPEPVSLILMGAGLLGIGGLRRRQNKAA
ncbi:PEP motif putative anchor domain protein [Desulfovibrio sp. X2]|uniref:PEP-CTERM sorting domain-containing protein n=1 Tax=Desulfovibrio sp. X2 TaxID=941449 RepID=UPI0003589DE8|nr:PEP-CTERM sorting domain-containing protein [Desulfovibrio sp. X2]EPR37253.1 PEP motif putative anchor domain protein [Desulfovibrio sp. X2]